VKKEAEEVSRRCGGCAYRQVQQSKRGHRRSVRLGGERVGILECAQDRHMECTELLMPMPLPAGG